MHGARLTIQWLLVAFALSLWDLPSAAQEVKAAARPGADQVEGITQPSADRALSFVRPGKLAKAHVQEGSNVKVQQVLLELDDKAEQVRLAFLKAKAEDRTRVKAADASFQQKKVDLQKLEWALKRGASTELEVEHARLDVVIAQLSLDMYVFTAEQDQREYEEARAEFERMKLHSPIDGRIERLMAHEGETCEANKEVVRVVQIDPLWVIVPLPVEMMSCATEGCKAIVSFAGGGQTQDVEGKVTFISQVADPASSTLAVRVEVPNPSRRPAGEHVMVRFQTPATAPATRGGSNGEPPKPVPAKADPPVAATSRPASGDNRLKVKTEKE